MPNYLLVHDRFVEQYLRFQADYPESANALQTNLKKVAAAPRSASGAVTLHDMPETLRGDVFRLWVGGSSGFRLVWIVARVGEDDVGCPVFVSPRRQNFDWDSAEWLETTLEIAGDLLEPAEGRFQKLIPT